MKIDNKKHYKFNLFSQYGLTFITSILGFISAPIALNYWKVEQFGVWAIITSLAAYLAISGLGVDAAAGILMTKNNSASIKKNIFRKSMIVVVLTAFIFFLLIMLINAIQPDWIRYLGKMDKQLIPTAKVTSVIFIGFFLLNLPFGVVANSFSAYKKAYINNTLNTLLSILLFFSLLIIVYTKSSLIIYALLYGCVSLLINIIKCIIYVFVSSSYVFSEKDNNDITSDNTYRTILITGVRLSLYGIAIIISSSISNFIISNSIDVASVTPYQLTYKLYFFSFTLLTAINLSAAPLYGKEFADKNWKWLVDKYNTFFIISVFLGGGIWLGGMLYFRDIIFLWVGNQGYAGILTVILLGAWIFTSSLSNINYVVVNSFNYTKGIALISWGEALIFITVSIILIKSIGIAGVAAGLLAGSLLVTQWALPLMIFKKSGKKLKYNFRILFAILSTFILSVPISYLQQFYIDQWYFRLLIGIIIFSIYLILCYRIIPKSMKFEFLSKIFNRNSFSNGV
jgi:O-antigen/teichoic acid export membrane protein